MVEVPVEFVLLEMRQVEEGEGEDENGNVGVDVEVGY